jgi:hypothetical protein
VMKTRKAIFRGLSSEAYRTRTMRRCQEKLI